MRCWRTTRILPLALLSLFCRFAQRATAMWDSFRDNAYGIYLCHYASVTWTQYLLLGAAMPALAKGVQTFVIAAAASWSLTAGLRRFTPAARVI